MLKPIQFVGAIIEPTSATDFIPLWDRNAEWERRIEMVANSRSFVHLSTLYIEWDEFGREILAELIAAQKRGVEIILIIDRFGQRLGGTQMSRSDRAMLRDELQRLRKAGGKVVMYSPKNLIDRCTGCGHHIKIQLSDGGEAIFGSSNLTRSSFKAWNEFSVAVRGPVVDVLARNFDDLLGSSIHRDSTVAFAETTPKQEIPLTYWFYDPNQDPSRLGALKRRQTNPLTAMLADKIRNAKKSIRLTSFYYKPVRVLVEAIEVAISRGVTVDIFHSHARSLSTQLPWLAAATGYPALLRQGANVYENQHGEHSKIILIDDQWTAFGSYNLEQAADSRCSEAMMVTTNRAVVDEISDIFQSLAADPDNQLVTYEMVRQWTMLQRVRTKLFLPMKGWF